MTNNNSKVNSNNNYRLPKAKDLEPYCELMEIKNLSLLEIENTDFKIKLKKPSNKIPYATSKINNDKPIEDDKQTSKLKINEKSSELVIKSPMVGTVYLSPEPNSKNFIYPGDKVKVGQTLLIVEAMKVMNNITSSKEGMVEKILVKNSQPVEFDQDLIILK